jgi:hypothetical protein
MDGVANMRNSKNINPYEYLYNYSLDAAQSLPGGYNC